MEFKARLDRRTTEEVPEKAILSSASYYSPFQK
jgi:hypothetical protein